MESGEWGVGSGELRAGSGEGNIFCVIYEISGYAEYLC